MFVRFVSFVRYKSITHTRIRATTLSILSPPTRGWFGEVRRELGGGACVISRATHAASRLAVAPPAPSRATSSRRARGGQREDAAVVRLVCRGAPARPTSPRDFFHPSTRRRASRQRGGGGVVAASRAVEVRERVLVTQVREEAPVRASAGDGDVVVVIDLRGTGVPVPGPGSVGGQREVSGVQRRTRLKTFEPRSARVSPEERHVRSAHCPSAKTARASSGDVRDQEAQGRVHEHDPVGVRPSG